MTERAWEMEERAARKGSVPPRSSRDLNGFQYHDNWLHNLLIASSMNGRKPGNR